MGFDNECILNIQSLAGEYFCPVCRLLVYPNEALQSQCTHLYCKPCLTYIVSTTQACPYDGYLVTETDSKPLVESNKALAETIGKITVHCLYHRSGCTWQGPLSECTSHCSGCAFGNSPVVCNRCGIQIVHRQVQEHAQNCPGVQSQVQQAEVAPNAAATGTAANNDPTQPSNQAGMTTSQTQTSHPTSASKSIQDPNHQVNSTPQTQAAVQATASTPEQWYQQQQLYQQYYQPYPGYDPYQQQYQQHYPLQQQSQPQVQPQAHLQAQPQSQGLPQSNTPFLAPVAGQPQNQAPVNLQQNHATTQPNPQIQTQSHPPPPRPQPFPPAQTQPVQPHLQHVQMSQYQQPHSQMQHLQPQQVHSHHPASQSQPQTHPQLPVPQPSQSLNPNASLQTQHSAAQAVTGYHSYPTQQPQQQMQVRAPQQNLMHMHGGPHLQFQPPVQIQNQYPQQSPQMRPHTTLPNQQAALLTSAGQIPNAPLAQVPPHGHQSGVSVPQRPLAQSVQQPLPQQFVQQQPPFTGQPLGSVQNQIHQQGPFAQQQLPAQSQFRPQGLPYPFQQQSAPYTLQQQSMQVHQSQNLLGRPMMANHGVQSQPYPTSAVAMQVMPMHLSGGQPTANQTDSLKANNQMQFSSEQQSGANMTEKTVAEPEVESLQKLDKKEANALDATSGLGGNAAETKIPEFEANKESVNDEHQPVGETENKSSAVDASAREHVAQTSELMISHRVKKEATESNKDCQDVPDIDHKLLEHSVSKDKEVQDGSLLETTPILEEHGGILQKDTNLPPVQGIPRGHGGPSMVQASPPGPAQRTQFPGLASAQFRPQGPGHVPHLGPHSLNQPHGPEIPLGGMPDPGCTVTLGRGPGHYGPPQHGFEYQSGAPQGPYNQGHAPYGPESQMGRQHPASRMEAENFPHHLPGYVDSRRPVHFPVSLEQGPVGPSSGMHSNMMRMNAAPGSDSSSSFGLRDKRFKSLPDGHVNQFPVDPTRPEVDFEEDLRQFPRSSHLDAETVPKFGSHFSSSRPVDRAPVFGMDSGLKLDPAGGSAPSRFPPPPHLSGSTFHPNDTGLCDGPAWRSDSGRNHPDFLGPVPGYGRRRMDGWTPGSPVTEYPGRSSRGFGGLSGQSGLDDIDGRDPPHFGDFHESGTPIFSRHLRRGEFEVPGNMRIGEHLRSGDLIGHDILPSHLRRGERFSPHSLQPVPPAGFGGFPGQGRMGEFPPPRLGEPGYRSSFPLRGFPTDGGLYRGDMESFDNSRKRKSLSMGWCRICKVDCETVEGLELHSQTRDHQKMAMDMVVTIKQNAKKQKIERSPLEDASKSRNVSFEGHGNKR